MSEYLLGKNIRQNSNSNSLDDASRIRQLRQKASEQYLVKILETKTMYSTTGKRDNHDSWDTVCANYDLAAIYRN